MQFKHIIVLFGVLIVMACSKDIKANSKATIFNLNYRSTASLEEDSECIFTGTTTLQDDAVLFAAGAYSGRKLDFQIDQSGNNASQIDVIVNYSKAPVVLMLGAYEPTVWNISRSSETKIIDVFVSGYHRQVVAGLETEIPRQIVTRDSQHPCGYFYVIPERLGELNTFAKRVFSRPVDKVYPAEDGAVLIGEPLSDETTLVSSSFLLVESYYDKSAPLAGRTGLEDAVQKGLLRRATEADVELWVNTLKQDSTDMGASATSDKVLIPPQKPSHEKAYVVLKDFSYPKGLYGDINSFFIPEGVPEPTGDYGHSTIYNFNTLKCEGVLCPSH